MNTRYTQREYERKVAAMSPECKVRRSVRQGAERDKAARDSAPTLQAVRPFDWERDGLGSCSDCSARGFQETAESGSRCTGCEGSGFEGGAGI